MSDETKIHYFQWHKSLGHTIFIKIEDEDLVKNLESTITVLGFTSIEEEYIKKLKIKNPREIKILKLTKSTPRISHKINHSQGLFDSFADESVYTQGIYNIYRFKKQGLLIFAENKIEWELALHYNQIDLDKFRVMLTRYLSFALAPLNIFGIWGIPVDTGIVVRRPPETLFESVFIDIKKNIMITYNGIQKIDSGIEILRLDQTLDRDPIKMKREELIPFLSSHSTYLSYAGLHPNLKSALIEIAKFSIGFIYPEKRFKPRASEA